MEEQSALLQVIINDVRGDSLPTDSEIDTLDMSQKQILYEQQKEIINRFKEQAKSKLADLQNELDSTNNEIEILRTSRQMRVARRPAVGSPKFKQTKEVADRISNVQTKMDDLRKMIAGAKAPMRCGRKVEIGQDRKYL